MIEARSASLVYEDNGKEVFACHEIDLRVKDGEFIGILGPSGSGKSSLLYVLCGLKRATSGGVAFDGQDYSSMSGEALAGLRLKNFGFVFQYPYLLGYLSALENVMLGYPNPGSKTKDEAEAQLRSLGLADKAHRFPHQLSGGERQRVCIGRALLGTKRVVFADEPTANLDHLNGMAVVETLVSNRGSGSLVMVTHDPSMLERADRVVTILDGKIHSV